jgi:hypothetical protein
MRKTFVYVGGKCYEKGTEPQPELSPLVMPDIKPYQSMVDGSWITSRSKHREHLKANNCVEIGDAVPALLKPKPLPDVSPQKRKELIVSQINSLTHDEFKRMVRRDVERVIWNSRKD